MDKRLMNSLKLVFPPLSNQEASWLWEDKAVREIVKESKLYFIAQREEVFFENFSLNGNSIKEEGEHQAFFDTKEDVCICSIGFDLVGIGQVEKGLKIFFEFDSTLSIVFEFGKKMVRISDKDGKILDWWTPDKLLFDNWRGNLHVDGLVNSRVFTKYKLHYVGISLEEDSFTRLFKRGHEKRAKILSDESQIIANARLSDELMIFFFDIDDLMIRSIDSSTYSEDELDNFVDGLLSPKSIDKLKIFADAEKAFVSLLDCTYNKVKFKNYPKSADGLHSEKLTGYTFQIKDNVTFITSKDEFVGDLNSLTRLPGPMADLIGIEGGKVKFIKA